MRKVILASKAGFCFGVKRAMNFVEEALQTPKAPIFTYGPMIHNQEVIRNLNQRGVRVIESPQELEGIRKGTVIIRSHGITRQEEEALKTTGLNIIDGTCPFVKRIHEFAREYSRQGCQVVIIGDPNHPEVRGICGWIEGKPAVVLRGPEEAQRFSVDPDTTVCILAQTTSNYNKFKESVEIIRKRGYHILVRNTICSATSERQKAAQQLSSEADAMIVIGDRSSSNSRKLFEICAGYCKNTWFIQTKEDLRDLDFSGCERIGITAGASTPNNIIEEVQNYMAEENLDFEQMLEEYDSHETIKNGAVVEGTVIRVKPDEIVLNINYKSDGIITRKEYSTDPNLDLTTVVKEGDKLEVKVIKVNDGEGQVLLSKRRLDQEKCSEKLREAFEAGEAVKGVVTQVRSGGLIAEADETKVFIPASLVSDMYERDLNKYKGQEIEFILTEFNPHRRRIIGDRKQLIIREKEAKQEALLARINVGDIVEGTVKNITDFGVFIDLGGADGLLHISEMSWGRVDNPRKLYKNGDKVKVIIKDIHDKKIALSAKFPEDNPWNNAADKFAVNTVVTGKVARMTDFGAFVELEPGVDALLHVSQISREHVNKPSDVLSIGQEIKAKIVDFDEENRKISLSIKALLKDDPDAVDLGAEALAKKAAQEEADEAQDADADASETTEE